LTSPVLISSGGSDIVVMIHGTTVTPGGVIAGQSCCHGTTFVGTIIVNVVDDIVINCAVANAQDVNGKTAWIEKSTNSTGLGSQHQSHFRNSNKFQD
jgi:hypothetical protein